MVALLTHYWNLCLLRAKPQDVPASQALFILVLLINVAVGVLALQGAFEGVGTAFVAALADNLLLMLFVWVLLVGKRWQARFQQVVTALLGSGVILMLIIYPLQMMITPEAQQTMTLPAFLLLLVLVWIHLVMGHIFRHALEIPFSGGVLLAMLFNLVSTLLVQGLIVGH